VLANYIDLVEELVDKDPRHKPIRRYSDLVLSTLRSLPPRSETLDVIRPPTYIVEKMREEPRVLTVHVGDKYYSSYKPEIWRSLREAYEESERPSKREESWIEREWEKRKYRTSKRRVVVAVLLALLLVASIYVLHLHFNPQLLVQDKEYLAYRKIADNDLLDEIRLAIYGSNIPESPEDAIINLWKWVSNNIEYGEINGDELCLYKGDVCYVTHSPELVFESKRGVCIDQAVFIATALVSVNISPAYVIAFNKIDHAVAGVVVHGVLYVMDQWIPPVEFKDYVDYVLGGDPGDIAVFEFAKISTGVGYRASDLPKVSLESYKGDILPHIIAYDASMILASRTGLVVSEYAKHMPHIIVSFNLTTWLEGYYTITLLNLRIPQQPIEIPLEKFYTPLFHEAWIEFIASKFTSYATNGIYRYVWIEIKNRKTVVAYFA